MTSVLLLGFGRRELSPLLPPLFVAYCLIVLFTAYPTDVRALELDLGGDFGELSKPKSPFVWSGFLRNETAYRIDEPRSITKIRNTIFVREETHFSRRLKLTATGWAYHDLAYDLFNYDTIAARYERDADQPLNFVENLASEKDSDVAEIRELYVDVLLDWMDIRAGRQFVVWGVLPGVRVLDEINPLDFRELIMPDLMDYRIPLWTLKVDLYNEWFDTQFLWIPDIRFHKPAPKGSEWELLQEVPGTVYPKSYTAKNSELGMRIAFDLLDTELTFNYFYTWDDFPTVFRDIRLNSSASEDSEFRPGFTRMEMIGGSFTRPMFGQLFIFKGEGSYVRGKFFGIGRVDRDQDGFIDSEGAVQRNHIRYGLGVDFSVWGADVSPGYTQTIVLQHDPAIIQPPVETAFNLFIRKSVASRVVMDFLGIYLLNIKEIYLKPRFTFLVTDRLSIAAGADFFGGSNSSSGIIAVGGATNDLRLVPQRARFLGNFADNDRLFMEFKYSF